MFWENRKRQGRKHFTYNRTKTRVLRAKGREARRSKEKGKREESDFYKLSII